MFLCVQLAETTLTGLRNSLKNILALLVDFDNCTVAIGVIPPCICVDNQL